MNMIKLSYKGFVFSANPSSITMHLSKSIAKKAIPFFSSKTQEICFEPCEIKGEGIFYGDEAREFAHKLMRIFKSDNSAYLFLPDSEPIMAYFDALDINYDSKNGCVKYSFSFTEDCKDKKHSFDFGYTFAKEGENLYDIANRCDIPVEKLFECNRYKDLFSVSAGDKVKLC